MTFPFYKQLDTMDCGAACLSMIFKHYGKSYPIDFIRNKCQIGRAGTSVLGLSKAAEALGFRTLAVKLQSEQLNNEIPVPFIAHWRQEHFVVVYKIKKNKIFVADPAFGLLTYNLAEFERSWIATRENNLKYGVCLLLEPTPLFYDHHADEQNRADFRFVLKYLKPYRKMLWQIFLAMSTVSIIQLIFPFLTQSIVDIGINGNNLNFIYLILIGQLFLYVGKTAIDFIRSWIMLHISTRINVSIISDFLIKLMKLPIGFFDAKMTGDLLQRIEDHHRIERFITGSSLEVIFSLINFIIFSVVLGIYDLKILGVFLGGSALYVIWVMVFMKARRKIDYKRFGQLADNQNNLIQIISGMQEIKLNNCEKQRRWKWERVQANLFHSNVSALSLNQYQNSGAMLLNESKNIIITILSASAVLKGDITLGMMMSVQYIIGQLNSPIQQFIQFIGAAQDAKISLERLSEIHNRPNEEKEDKDNLINSEILDKTIRINDIYFNYSGQYTEPVLKNINLTIPEKKVTAIVGASGSGKTTLLKLLLGFYPPVSGKIMVGDTILENISSSYWRSKCGVVMQDGFIFSDTIATNIGLIDESVDKIKLKKAVQTANIQEFVEMLPLGYNTKIGADGHGLSQGQKQRILIARAVYKDPDFIFLDEATNALDANNEKVIMSNLDNFFKGKTVVVVAHRLSTVKNADQIIVLDKGSIVESGTHQDLADKKGYYYNLVKNQLELGN